MAAVAGWVFQLVVVSLNNAKLFPLVSREISLEFKAHEKPINCIQSVPVGNNIVSTPLTLGGFTISELEIGGGSQTWRLERGEGTSSSRKGGMHKIFKYSRMMARSARNIDFFGEKRKIFGASRQYFERFHLFFN